MLIALLSFIKLERLTNKASRTLVHCQLSFATRLFVTLFTKSGGALLVEGSRLATLKLYNFHSLSGEKARLEILRLHFVTQGLTPDFVNRMTCLTV